MNPNSKNDLYYEMKERGEEYNLTAEIIYEEAAKLIKKNGNDLSKFLAGSNKYPANSKLYNKVYEHFEKKVGDIKKKQVIHYCHKGLREGEIQKILTELEKK